MDGPKPAQVYYSACTITKLNTTASLKLPPVMLRSVSVAAPVVRPVTHNVYEPAVAAPLTNDTIILTISGGQATPGSYNVFANALSAGSVSITLRNISGGPLSEAVVINFAIIHCV